MHRALRIQEILWNIFEYCRLGIYDGFDDIRDLPSLARTCHAFKEPALDVLWRDLEATYPLAQCLPEASHLSQFCPSKFETQMRCSFSRSLTQIEWGALQSYTRRIRSMSDYPDGGLDWGSFKMFMNSPTTDPLFPNLRSLYSAQLSGLRQLSCMSLPSLRHLLVDLSEAEYHPEDLRHSIESFTKFSPNVKSLQIMAPSGPDITSSEIFTACIRPWKDLQKVYCDLSLDEDALVHLSSMPGLTHLDFISNDTLLESNPPLVFSSLHELTLYSKTWKSISQLLFHTRMLAIRDLTTTINAHPCREDISSFLNSIQTFNTNYTIQKLRLTEARPGTNVDDTPRPVLSFQDLRPCLAFSNLHCLHVDLGCNVLLADKELLAMASAWPHLEHLSINEYWGWNSLHGITPNGLLQLLQTCRSLDSIALAMNTGGFTEYQPSVTGTGRALPPRFTINVLDSAIEAESVSAIAAFFSAIAPRSDFIFYAWSYPYLSGKEEKAYSERWTEVYTHVMGAFA